MRRRFNLHIVFVGLVFTLLFALMGYSFVSYALNNKRDLFGNNANHRDTLLEDVNRRGSIYASDGTALAYTDESGTRIYPAYNLYAHAVGYSALGGSGLEEYCKYDLLHCGLSFSEQAEYQKNGQKCPGNDVWSTLDPGLQQAAYDAMSGYTGAVIVTDPKTGRILALVSKPDFDPNTIEANWDYFLNTDTEGTLLNRATQGQYPPGSTFKMVDVVEYLQENPDKADDYLYTCTGTFEQDGESLHCFHNEVHGQVDLEESFALSCNCSFSNIGLGLDRAAYIRTLDTLLFNKDLPYDMPCSGSKINLTRDISTREMIQVSIGQGTTQMSPLHLNMLTMAAANGGTLMKPYMLDKVTDPKGGVLASTAPTSCGSLFSGEVAEKLTGYMRAVVTEGTAVSLSGRSYKPAGKTGSAEFDEETNSHAWFTGFAPFDDPRICVTVIIEGEGTGSGYAVPVAGRIMDVYFGS